MTDLDYRMIGTRIRAYRRERGLTQEQVVAKLQLKGLKISKSTYAKIETNRMNLKVSELVGLRQIFDVEYNDFFQGLEEPCLPESGD